MEVRKRMKNEKEKESGLPVEVIPDIENTVHTCDEEETRSDWTPAAGGEVGWVILGGHDRGLDVLHPDLGGPVTHSDEALRIGWVSLDRVDWTVMLARTLVEDCDTVVSERVRGGGILLAVLQVDHQDDTLLCADEILGRTSFGIVLH